MPQVISILWQWISSLSKWTEVSSSREIFEQPRHANPVGQYYYEAEFAIKARELHSASEMQSGQNSRITRPKHVIGLMCANCARVMRGRWPVCIHVAYKYTRSSYRTRSPWHCAIVQCTRNDGRAWPDQPSAFRAIAPTCTCVLNAVTNRPTSQGHRSRGMICRIPSTIRARLSRETTRSRIWVSTFCFKNFFRWFPRENCIYSLRAKLHTHVCMYSVGNNVDFHAPAGSSSEIRRRTSNELDEVWKANWSRTEIGIWCKRSTCFAKINGCRVAAYEYVSIRLAVFRSVNRICSRVVAITTGGSAEQIYRILGGGGN